MEDAGCEGEPAPLGPLLDFQNRRIYTVEELVEHVDVAIHQGDLTYLLKVAHKLTPNTLLEVKVARWQKLLHYLGIGNAPLSEEERKRKLQLVEQRVRMEKDISQVLSLLCSTPTLDDATATPVVNKLQHTYKVNKETANFGQTFPEWESYFMMAAVVGNCFFSVYDGKTEYKLGQKFELDVAEGSNTQAMLVHRTVQSALNSKFPSTAKLFRTPKAILRFRCPAGTRIAIQSHSAIALAEMTCVEVVCRVLQNTIREIHGKPNSNKAKTCSVKDTQARQQPKQVAISSSSQEAPSGPVCNCSRAGACPRGCACASKPWK